MTPDESIRALRMRIACETGWTLDYVDSMNLHDVGDYLAYNEFLDMVKAQASSGGSNTARRKGE